ncbi:unnamed protein product [Phytophthora fragariaefolia]|uniref:Unnamed protein product n=1 Tax=Phytophthora fragariaefolia TaxID=1490495 RepID=A0A9W6YJM7_9STRA|nr:unnamed protein product [Phytophthora fragariaefolia]
MFHNNVEHIPDEAMQCEGPHKTVVTAEMKSFLFQQDECGIPHQLILNNMRHKSDIIEPKRGYPTLSQVTNCAKRTDDDSFVVVVTRIDLINASIDYASTSKFNIFHSDATFKLSDLGYPLITCGFSDPTGSYQLAAISVVCRCTSNEYVMCLTSLTPVIKRVHPTAMISIDAVMGDTENANEFQQVAPFERI